MTCERCDELIEGLGFSWAPRGWELLRITVCGACLRFLMGLAPDKEPCAEVGA